MFSDEALYKLSSGLLSRLEESSCFKSAKTILLYYALPDEVNTHRFIEKWSGIKQIILPVVEGDHLLLKRYNGKEDLKMGAYRILEPCGPNIADMNEIDLCIVPGVAFDGQGHRLGRGKGYYDRLLPKIAAPKIGICFHFQLLDSVPSESFDIVMDEVWTEKGKI